MKRNIHRKQIINFLMLLLCTSLLTGTSFAKETEIMELDREGLNLLHLDTGRTAKNPRRGCCA